MHTGVKIAISGKGGVGKTTVCAIWAHLFASDGLDVLAVDADPNTTLACAFGISLEDAPMPLIKMKELIGERTGTGREAVGAYFRLNPKVSDLPEKYWVEIGRQGLDAGKEQAHGRLKLLVLGDVVRAGGGCACPEGAFLKAMLNHSILQREELVLIDLAAGVEFMGRACVQGIDVLVTVVEPSSTSIDTSVRIAKMAREIGIKHVVAFANKIPDSKQLDVVKEQLSEIPLIGSFKFDPGIQRANLEGIAAIDADINWIKALTEAKKQLLDLIFRDSESDN
ncbi:MAG: ATP-binding protein [Planctomycetota bacterium]